MLFRKPVYTVINRYCKNNNIMMRFAFILLLVCIPKFLLSQSDAIINSNFEVSAKGTLVEIISKTGTIKGRVVDAVTNESLPGVNIVIKGTLTGTITGLDGNYELISIKSGAFDIQYSYVSYKTEVIRDVQVNEGEVTLLDVALNPTTTDMDEVVVKGKFRKRTENALLKMKGKSATFMDGISFQHISNMGDNDAAGALTRVTGLSVESGKYVYVRGLGDRYTKITLNGADIPGLDPNRNTVQMDIFPTNLIENIIVNKTFSANLPGDFTGGHIDITTKDFPESFTLTYSTSLGYNPQANLNNAYLSYEGGHYDWLGIDDGTRDIPKAAVSIPYYSNPNKLVLTEITEAFNKTMEPIRKKSLLNHSHSFSVGNQFKLLGNPFGFLTGIYYSRKYNFYDNGSVGYYRQTDEDEEVLNREYLYNDVTSNTDVLIGGIVNLHYKLSENSKIGLNLIRNQNGENSARYMYGETQTDEIGTFRETRVLKYSQRALTSLQLKGEHLLAFFNKTKITWLSSYTLSQQDEPDLRFFTNGHFPENTGTDAEYEISPSKYKVPTRLFRSLWEDNFNNKLDITIPFQLHGSTADFTMGTFYIYKNRRFSERKFDYIRNTDIYNGSINNYLKNENIGLNDPDGFGLYIQDATNTKNSYDANQSVFALFAMVDMPLFEKLRVVAGMRFEQTNIFSKSKNDRYKPGTLELKDILPSLNLNYQHKNMNLRMAYNRTLARPTFREIAPFESEDFHGGIVYVGNPDLQRTLIDNVDIRWEYFINSGEIISFSTFYKNFINPIELADDIRSNNSQLTWRNVEEAKVIGLEIEIRKGLKFKDPVNNLILGANFTYLNSYVSIDSLELISLLQIDSTHNGKRAMFGQSPYILNAFITYKNDDIGLSANLGFNISGKKLIVVMRAPTPNVFEQPNGKLNFNLIKKIGKKNNISLKFSIKNILNSSYKSTYSTNNEEYIFTKYTIGRTFSFGVTYLMK